MLGLKDPQLWLSRLPPCSTRQNYPKFNFGKVTSLTFTAIKCEYLTFKMYGVRAYKDMKASKLNN